jgi:hypothetical protein|tara:strand:- start:3517 stop:3735 length:219 start_codon:yes stop_codon:yes gene_type:complete
MDAVFKNLGSFISGIVGLLMSLLGLGIVAEILLGAGSPFTVIDNITGLVAQFAGGGFVGLVALLVVLSFLKK